MFQTRNFLFLLLTNQSDCSLSNQYLGNLGHMLWIQAHIDGNNKLLIHLFESWFEMMCAEFPNFLGNNLFEIKNFLLKTIRIHSVYGLQFCIIFISISRDKQLYLIPHTCNSFWRLLHLMWWWNLIMRPSDFFLNYYLFSTKCYCINLASTISTKYVPTNKNDHSFMKISSNEHLTDNFECGGEYINFWYKLWAIVENQSNKKFSSWTMNVLRSAQ